MPDDYFGIDPDRLRNRLKFLVGRAEVHSEFSNKGYERRAIAATAYRDAASIALLLEDADSARRLLKKAGNSFLELGLVHGAVLLALAEGAESLSAIERHSDLIRGVENQRNLDDVDERPNRPLEESARTATSQLLAMYQLGCLLVDPKFEKSSDLPFRQELDRRAGFKVGVTGLSIESYLRMGLELGGASFGKLEHSPRFIFRSAEAILSFRFEAIQSAMKDRYHWNRILRPSVLLDFDTLILGSLALSSDLGMGPFENFLSDEIPFFDAPFVAAKLLKQGPELEPIQTY